MLVELPKRSNWYGYCNTHDYKPRTPYFIELWIAIQDGKDTLVKTLNKIKLTKLDYKDFTELVLVVNLLSWDLYETNEEVSQYLADEYYNLKDMFYDTYTDEAAKDYFWEMTD